MEKKSKNIIENINNNETSLGFGISSIFIDEIRNAIRANDKQYLEDKILILHQADIADIFEILSKEERKTLFSFLQDKLPAEALASLDEQVFKGYNR